MTARLRAFASSGRGLGLFFALALHLGAAALVLSIHAEQRTPTVVQTISLVDLTVAPPHRPWPFRPPNPRLHHPHPT